MGRGRLASKEGVHGQNVTRLNYYNIQKRLEQKSFRISQTTGFGIFGKRVRLDRRWQRPILPVSNLILVKAKYQSHKQVVTPFRFSNPQAAGVRSAAIDGLNREVV